MNSFTQIISCSIRRISKYYSPYSSCFFPRRPRNSGDKTYKPNQSYKMIPCGWMRGGLCLRHYSSDSDTVVLCRPMDAHVIVNVDFWKEESGELHIDCWRMSGTNCLHTVVPEACNWWHLSNLLFEQQGLTHVQLVFRDKLVYKTHYNQSIEQEEFPDVNENEKESSNTLLISAGNLFSRAKPSNRKQWFVWFLNFSRVLDVDKSELETTTCNWCEKTPRVFEEWKVPSCLGCK